MESKTSIEPVSVREAEKMLDTSLNEQVQRLAITVIGLSKELDRRVPRRQFERAF